MGGRSGLSRKDDFTGLGLREAALGEGTLNLDPALRRGLREAECSREGTLNADPVLRGVSASRWRLVVDGELLLELDLDRDRFFFDRAGGGGGLVFLRGGFGAWGE